jgi:Siphovirus ReqiPepy6 Gp37-like protein
MPATRYQVRIYSPDTGELLTILTNWHSLFLERKLNSFDEMQLSLHATDPNVKFFKLDTILEVWRLIDNPGARYYRETTLMHRTEQRELSTEQREIFVSFSRGLIDLLRRRHVQYYSTTAFTLKQGPADDIMKEFVIENAGPGANNAARRTAGHWNAAVLGLTVEDKKSIAPIWKGKHAWDNLLDVLTDISSTTSVDFDVVRTGPRSFEFKTFYPQLGVDRSNFIIFSPQLGNMTDVSYAKSRSEEVTAVVVGGQGEGVDRRNLTRLNASAADDSPWNLIESNEDGRSQPTLADLQHIGDTALQEKAFSETFTFKVLQTDTRKYGSEYNLGDKIRAKYRDIELTMKIIKVSMQVSEGHEEVNLEFSERPVEIVRAT